MKKLLLGVLITLTSYTFAQCDFDLNQVPETGTTIRFDRVNVDTLNGTFIYDFGDASSYVQDTSLSVWHDYPLPGTYPIVVQYMASDSLCSFVFDDSVFVPEPQGSVCEFTVDQYPYDSIVDFLIPQMDLPATGSFDWFFGDGEEEFGVKDSVMVHIYMAPGDYPLNVVYLADDSSCTYTYYGNVMIQGDTVTQGGMCEFMVEQNQFYVDSSSVDFFIETALNDLGVYNWDLGDGTDSLGLREPEFYHVYAEPGDYEFNVTYLADDSSCTFTYNGNVHVPEPPAPMCDFEVTYSSFHVFQEIDTVVFHLDFHGRTIEGDFFYNMGDSTTSPDHIYDSILWVHGYDTTMNYPYSVTYTSWDTLCSLTYYGVVEFGIDTLIPNNCDIIVTRNDSSNHSIGLALDNIDDMMGTYVVEYDNGDSLWLIGNSVDAIYEYTMPGYYQIKIDFISDDQMCSSVTFDTKLVADDTVQSVNCELNVSSIVNEGTAVVDFFAGEIHGVEGHYKWHFEDGTVMFGEQVLHNFDAVGMHIITVDFISNDSLCAVSGADTIDVVIPDCEISFESTVVDNQVDLKGLNNGPAGMGAFIWTINDDHTYIGNEVTHIFDAPGNYEIDVFYTDPNGLCSDSASGFVSIVSQTIDVYNVSGSILDAVDSAIVVLFQYNGAEFDQINAQVSFGTYEFTNVEEGQYILAVHPFQADYITTYSGNTNDWTQAQLVSVNIDLSGIDVDLIEFVETGDPNWDFGLDTLVGYVLNQSGQLRSASSLTGGTPVINATVELLDLAGNLLASTTTDEFGAYQFENLVEGEYQLRYTYPGSLEAEVQTVAVDGDADTRESASEVKLEKTSVVLSTKPETIDVGIFPTPFSNVLNVKGDVSSIRLSNLLGNTLITTGDKSIDTSSLPAGIYLLTITSSGVEQVVKVVKN